MADNRSQKIVLAGGAGLVGQNLIPILKERGCTNIVVLDKHRTNLAICRDLHPDIVVEEADLAQRGSWEGHLAGAGVVVMLQAQIGGSSAELFRRNNLVATELIIAAILRENVPYTVHVSSSVVKSEAADQYSQTKRSQEELVLASGLNCVVLRPTLMFGWFDRKHLGWLSRFMRRVPIFPVPGSGRFQRQPLYAGDFCRIIAACIESRISGQVFDISGLETVDYIDIIRAIRRATGAKAVILRIPYWLFSGLLRAWALFDRDPPFTAAQLKALVANERFAVIDWPGVFAVKPTPFPLAIDETFNHPVYSRVVLEF